MSLRAAARIASRIGSLALALAVAPGASCRPAAGPGEVAGAPGERAAVGCEDPSALPRREDHGTLVVLRLAGGYQAMGAQQVALLGPVADETRLLLEGRWNATLEHASAGGRFAEALTLPLLAHVAPFYERSGLFEELGGMAQAFSISRGDALRLFLAGLYGGSTSFVATASATREGRALLGRNIDWYDQQGVLRPVLTHYCPHNGDYEHVSAGWPLVGIPIAGLNEHGLAISVNFFHADEMVGLSFAQVPYRLALQRARNVAEAIAIFADVRSRGGTGFVLLADASGAIALLECLPSACARYQPEGDWIAQANHARTAAMRPRDLGRNPDSLRRQEAMEAAVRARKGRIDVPLSAEILRDRSSSPWVDGSTVANPAVLSSIVIDPAARVLWHSTQAQPLAPFGTLAAFPLGAADRADSLPADPRLADPTLAAEAEAVRLVQRAADRLAARDPQGALQLFAQLPDAPRAALDPGRLAWLRALAHLRAGEPRDAAARLATIDLDRASFEVAAAALVGAALVQEDAGDVEAARALRLRARSHLDAHPELDAPDLIGLLREASDPGAPRLGVVEAAARLPLLEQVR